VGTGEEGRASLGGVAVGGRGPRGGKSVEICAGESRVVWAVGWRSRDGDDSGRGITGKKMTGHVPASCVFEKEPDDATFNTQP
jgi:hypothetical protein